MDLLLPLECSLLIRKLPYRIPISNLPYKEIMYSDPLMIMPFSPYLVQLEVLFAQVFTN